jgi:hypothetical protein
MKNFIRTLIIVIFSLSVLCSGVISQNRININNLLSLYGQTAYSFFLSANRPGFGVDAYTNSKGHWSVFTGISYSDECIDVPSGFSYGVTDHLEISVGISPFTETFNFAGSKVSGLGDSYAALKYSFLESENFVHAFQFLAKIPTASSQKEIGTGKLDLCFGIAQGFTFQNFGYDLSLELNLLHKRDFPATKKYPPVVQNRIDSLKNEYNYTYEPEIIISGGPSFELSRNVSAYAGYSFARNTKLNYNSSSIYGGFGFTFNRNFTLSLGGSYGLEETGTWGASTGLGYNFP